MNVKGLQLRLIEVLEEGGGRNVHVSVCDPTLPECKRWITMETDQQGNRVIMMCLEAK